MLQKLMSGNGPKRTSTKWGAPIKARMLRIGLLVGDQITFVGANSWSREP